MPSALLAFLCDAWGKQKGRIIVAAISALGISVACLAAIISSKSPAAPRQMVAARTTSIVPHQLTQKNYRLLHQAEQILTASCMRRRGFRYLPIPFSSQAEPGPLSMYFISSVTWARRNGFGDQVGSESNADPNSNYINHLSPSRQNAYGVAMYGFGPGLPNVQIAIPQGGVVGHGSYGCQAVADGKLYGNFRAWFDAYTIVGNLKPASAGEVINNPQYKRALTRWAHCIRARGYAWSSPADAAATFQQRLTPGHLIPAEKRAAVTAARCDSATGLTSTTSRLAASYVSSLREHYQREVNAYRRLQLEAIPVAHSVILSNRKG
jgi:hypothetical protein